MFSTYPYWDVSYLVAVVFTLGSVVWCINAFFVWLPLQDPSTEFNGEIADAGGWTAFVGATIFEFGSILLMIEAVNENRADCFGWALEEALEEKGLMRLKPAACIHHHKNKGNLIGKGKGAEGKDRVVFPFSFHNSRSSSRLVIGTCFISAASVSHLLGLQQLCVIKDCSIILNHWAVVQYCFLHAISIVLRIWTNSTSCIPLLSSLRPQLLSVSKQLGLV
jgi:hypothetical protein